MKVILISDFSVNQNPELINKLFTHGLYRFHIREKKMKREKINEFLTGIQPCFKSKISIHGNGVFFGIDSHGNSKNCISKSCHSIKDIITFDRKYYFLSPIFDSISKTNYYSKFEPTELKLKLKKLKNKTIFALGGIDDKNINKIINIGFEGVAVKGFIWNRGNNPKEQFFKILNALK